MKIITVLLSAAFLLCNCGGSNYTVSGHYGLAPGDSVFLFASNKSIISSGVMTADTTFRLKGKVAGTDIATLSDRDRLLTPTLIFLEAGDIRLEPREEGVYEATGTPLNDSLLLLNRKLEALRNEYIKMTPATPHEEVEAIFARFEEIPRAMMNANLDNIFGLWLFSAYEFPNMLQDDTRRAQIRPCMTAFSPGMQAHTIMQELQKELAGFENAQIGHRFTNLTLTDTQGEPISLSSLVEPGRWVLLDFWARHTPHTKPRGLKFTPSRSTTTRQNGGRSRRPTTCRGSMSWASTQTNGARPPQPMGSRRSPRTS